MTSEESYSELLKQADTLQDLILRNEESIRATHADSTDVSVMRFSSPKLLRDASKRGKLAERYVKKCIQRNLYPYLINPSRIPLNFQSNDDALKYLSSLTAEHKAWMVAQGLLRLNSRLKREDVIEILVKSRLAMTTVYDPSTQKRSLLVYDYDSKIYGPGEDLLSQYVNVITGVVDTNTLSTVMMSLTANHSKLAVYNPPYDWQVPVANGVLNMLTQQIDPSTPLLTVQSRIGTAYDSDAQEPEFSNGMTFERFVDEFANHNQRRFKLVMQIMKAAVLGYSPVPTFIQIIGPGGDGKSTLMKLLSGIIGSTNVSHATIGDLSTDDGMRSLAGKHIDIGMDNGESFISNKTLETIKKVTSREAIIVARKYLDAMIVTFRGIMIQVANKPFRFQENSSAVDRRVVTLKADNNFYSNNSVDREIERLVTDPRWHRYILRYLVEKVEFFEDFEDVDRDVLVNTLDADDPIGSFCFEMLDEGVLDKLTVLPVRLAYAAYVDWHNRNVSGSIMYSSRSFTNAFNTTMKQYGYELRTSNRRRVRSLESIQGIDYFESFNSLSDGQTFKQLYESNAMTPIIERDELVNAGRVKQNSRRGRRDSRWCSSLEYYRLETLIDNDVTSEYEYYLDLIESMFERSDYSIEVFDTYTLQSDDSTDYLSGYNDEGIRLDRFGSNSSIKSQFDYIYETPTLADLSDDNSSSVEDEEFEREVAKMDLSDLAALIDEYCEGLSATRLERVCVMEEVDRRLGIDTNDYDLDQRAAKLKIELERPLSHKSNKI